MTTLKDVAKLAGVSPTTVSIVVNGNATERRIPPATVDKVNAAVKELNYHPSITARALRCADSSKFTVGIYWSSDFRSSFLSRFITGVQRWKNKTNADFNIMICPYKFGELDKDSSLYAADSFNAVIIATANEIDMQYLKRHRPPMPTVLNNRISEIYHTVSINNIELGQKAAQHLIARKAKKIGVICLNNTFFAMSRSVKGFIAYCKEQGLDIPPEHIISTGFSFEEGYDAGKALLKDGFIPDAVFCDNDSVAIGFMEYCRSRNINVPDDIQVIAVGLGNPNYARYIHPSLTVVNVPLEDLAEECMKLIADIAYHKVDDLQHRVFDSNLLQRGSTKML